MGSTSDLPVHQRSQLQYFKGFDIEVDVDIVSAHRNAPRKNYTILAKTPT